MEVGYFIVKFIKLCWYVFILMGFFTSYYQKNYVYISIKSDYDELVNIVLFLIENFEFKL